MYRNARFGYDCPADFRNHQRRFVMDALESRALKLAKELSDFGAELRLACAYTQVDPASSLTKSRIVMEKLLLDVYVHEMGHEPRKPLLGDMLADNQFTRKIERRILSRMNAIRDMANLGPHGEAVEASDASRVLDDLCNILDWYVDRNTSSRPAPSADSQTAADTQSAGSIAGPASDPARKPKLRLWTALVGAAVLLFVGGFQLRHWLSGDKPEPAEPNSSVHAVADTVNPKHGFDDMADLQGTWKTVEVETEGEVGNPLYNTMLIEGHSLSYSNDGRGGISYTFDLYPEKRPKRITLLGLTSNVRIDAIYAFEGDVLKICHDSMQDAEKATRPAEFQTRPGSHSLLMTFKRR